MCAVPTFAPTRFPHPWATGSLIRELASGFGYWCAIVAALEPGNWVNMAAAGEAPRLGQELLRLVCAGLLGSVSAPIALRLSRRFPVALPHRTRNLAVHGACALALATALIVIAHLLAGWLLSPAHVPTLARLRGDLAANEALLIAGLLGLSALAHALVRRPSIVRFAAKPEAIEDAAPSSGPLNSVEIKVRGVKTRVAMADVDWIEAQGNYLALHVGPAAFLLREPLAHFARRLDPAQFVRIHRGTIVAINRVAAIDPAANGDAIVRLRDRHVLRVSRRYRKALADGCNA